MPRLCLLAIELNAQPGQQECQSHGQIVLSERGQNQSPEGRGFVGHVEHPMFPLSREQVMKISPKRQALWEYQSFQKI